MKISYFPKQTALNSGPVLTAFLNSCKHHGWTVVENDLDADAAVIWSVLWFGKMLGNKNVYEHYRKQNKPVLIIEVGSLVRGVTWKVSLNNINRLGIFGDDIIIDNDRPKKLGLLLKKTERQQNFKPILIAGQHEKSLQWEAQPSTSVWIENLVHQLTEYTKREIIFRPHPRFLPDLQSLKGKVKIELPKKIYGTYDSFDLTFDQYYCVINHNSGPAVQAAIAGLPVICDSSSMAYPVSNTIDQIENFSITDRSRWLIDLSHTEYTVTEIEQGIPLKKLQKFLHL